MDDNEIKHDMFVVLDKNDDTWIGNEGVLPDELERLIDALAQPDKYYVQFREATECIGNSFKEAYDLAMAHRDDWFELIEFLWFGVDCTAESFINDRILNALAAREDYQGWEDGIPFNHEIWNDEIDAFVWDRVLKDNEIKEIKNKYGIST